MDGDGHAAPATVAASRAGAKAAIRVKKKSDRLTCRLTRRHRTALISKRYVTFE